ncbi:MAG: hypothetical protein IAG13_19540, partial [Deltaproteobacteria bacterium]|nr:hypothetical protein [Nannocystaceae bacterium]
MWLASCATPEVVGEGLLGEPIALMSGDASPLPRLAFVDEGCPGADAQGGCDDPGRPCAPLLIDSLTPLTTLKREGIDEPSFHRECLEVRGGTGLAAEAPSGDALEEAVARFRFLDVPMVRAPAEGSSRWSWSAGDNAGPIEQ